MPASRDSPVGVETYLVFFPLHRLRTSRTSGEDAFRSFTKGRELRPASSVKLGLLPLSSWFLSGSDRLGLSAFPPLQTGQAPFNASGFPVRSPYCSAAGWRLVRSSQGAPVIVPTDHRHLLSLVHLLNRRPKTSPGRPSPCPDYYGRAFGYYAASVLSSARWHSDVSSE